MILRRKICGDLENFLKFSNFVRLRSIVVFQIEPYIFELRNEILFDNQVLTFRMKQFPLLNLNFPDKQRESKILLNTRADVSTLLEIFWQVFWLVLYFLLVIKCFNKIFWFCKMSNNPLSKLANCPLSIITKSLNFRFCRHVITQMD